MRCKARCKARCKPRCSRDAAEMQPRYAPAFRASQVDVCRWHVAKVAPPCGDGGLSEHRRRRSQLYVNATAGRHLCSVGRRRSRRCRGGWRQRGRRRRYAGWPGGGRRRVRLLYPTFPRIAGGWRAGRRAGRRSGPPLTSLRRRALRRCGCLCRRRLRRELDEEWRVVAAQEAVKVLPCPEHLGPRNALPQRLLNQHVVDAHPLVIVPPRLGHAAGTRSAAPGDVAAPVGRRVQQSVRVDLRKVRAAV